MKDIILFGDCRETLSQIDEQTCQMCVTSPPYYGLRDYTNNDKQIGLEQTPDDYIKELVEVFRLVRDTLTDDGVLFVNIGDSYYNYRPGKGQALVKQTLSSSKQDLPDDCPRRGNKLEGYKEKDLIGIPWMLAFALRQDGWYLRQDIIWNKPNPMPESVKDRCSRSHEYIFLFSKKQNYYFDVESIKVPTVDGKGLKRRKSVWDIKLQKNKSGHSAVFPDELIQPCILSGSKENDIILDPFIGTGTTGRVAKKLNRHYIGCELNVDYKPILKVSQSN